MNYVLTIILYLFSIALLSYMAGDTIGSIIKGEEKIIKLANKGKISLGEALKYCPEEQRKKFGKRKIIGCLFIGFLIILLFMIIRVIIEDFATWSISLIIITLILEVVVAVVVFYISYKKSDYYIKASYSGVIQISKDENTNLIYFSDGEKIVDIIKLTIQDDESIKQEHIKPSKELLDLLDERTGGKKEYLLY